MAESLRRYFERSVCRHCGLIIQRSIQPRAGTSPLRSWWTHVVSKTRECPTRNADPGHNEVIRL